MRDSVYIHQNKMADVSRRFMSVSDHDIKLVFEYFAIVLRSQNHVLL